MSLESTYQEILASKNDREELAGLTSDSKVSIWGNFAFIVAYAISLLQQMFAKHKSELRLEIINQKRHKAADIRQRLLNFQLGFSLKEGTDEFENGDATSTEIESSKIIKYAAVTESTNEKRVICKIATEVGEELAPVGESEMEAVIEYIKEIKAAGVPYTLINYLPDLLWLKMRIFRDPLILDSYGTHRIDGGKPVEDALKEYMKELPFNGELVLQELCNKLEKVEGVRIVQLDYAQTAWLDVENDGYADMTTIDVKTIPVSGYFKLANAEGEFDLSGISYVV